jgi:hypothetical protein
MLFGPFMFVQAFESFEGFATSLALPFRLGGHTDVGLLEQNALFFEELLRDWFKVGNLTLGVVVMELSGTMELVARKVGEL